MNAPNDKTAFQPERLARVAVEGAPCAVGQKAA